LFGVFGAGVIMPDDSGCCTRMRGFRRLTGEGSRQLVEGRGRAKRDPRLTAAQKAEARRRRAQGATLAELARSYHVGKSTISRLTR